MCRRMRIITTTITCKVNTIDNISAKFAIKTLPKIKVYPDYKAINKMMHIIYADVLTLPNPQVGGHHRHIGIIVNPMIYTTLSTRVCTNPPNPLFYLVVSVNATASHQGQLHLQNKEGRIIYENTGTVDEALNNRFIDSTKDIYLKELNNKYTNVLAVK